MVFVEFVIDENLSKGKLLKRKLSFYFSRRHQHYHSQRSTRTAEPPTGRHQMQQQQPLPQPQQSQPKTSHPQRPANNYYEYETIPATVRNHNPHVHGTNNVNNNNNNNIKMNDNNNVNNYPNQWNTANMNSSLRGNRGQYVTQIQIKDTRDKQQLQQPPASKV